MFELLVASGRDPLNAISMLIPEAHENDTTMDPALRAYYDYQRTLSEPWDGPAAICFSNGLMAGATMDRNGLRPLRYWVTKSDKVILGSEVGLVDLPVERVVERGRLGPGEMLAVTVGDGNGTIGSILRNEEIKHSLSRRMPYQSWLNRSIKHVVQSTKGLGQLVTAKTLMRVLGPAEEKRRADAEKREVAPEVQDRLDNRVRFKKAFGYSKEDEELIFKPMMDTAHEPIGSMGDDTPIAAFSAHPQHIYRYFKQRFAEVTNPPIDPLLERRVMSLNITFGRKGRILEESQHAAFLIRLPSPIVTEQQMNWITSHPEFRSHVLDATFDPTEGEEGLQRAVERLQDEALATIKSQDVSYLVLSDRAVGPSKAPIPMLMAVGAVHHGLIKAKSRMAASILVESAEPREDHHIACLIGFGASLVHPYMAYETVAELAQARITEAEAGIGTKAEES